MRSKSRPASKALLKALAEHHSKSPEDKFLDSKGHPESVTAFGHKLTRSLIQTENACIASYRGGAPGQQFGIWENSNGSWTASATIGEHVITPYCTSSSIPAAIRNLRGHLLNLELDLGKLLHPRKTNAKKKG